MKKIVTIAAIALLGAIVLPSCKKDYTCVCTYDIGNGQESQEVDLGKQTKKDAKTACEAYNTTWASYAGINCKLK